MTNSSSRTVGNIDHSVNVKGKDVAASSDFAIRTVNLDSATRRIGSHNTQFGGCSLFSMVNSLWQNFTSGIPLLVSDLSGILLSVFLSSFIAQFLLGTTLTEFEARPETAAAALTFIFFYLVFGLYPGVGLNPIVEMKQLCFGTLIGGATLILSLFAFGGADQSLLGIVCLTTVLSAVTVPLLRMCSREVLSKTTWWAQPALVIGGSEASAELFNTLKKNKQSGLVPVGIISDSNKALLSDHWVGHVSQISDVARERHVHWALIATDRASDSTPRYIANCGEIRNIVVVPQLDGCPTMWSRTRDIGGLLGLHTRARLLSPGSQIVKRTFDVVATLTGLLIASPFLIPMFLVTVLFVKLRSPGPIFYNQPRVGRNGKLFKAWKFRTMIVDADAVLQKYLSENPELEKEWALTQKLKRDPRVLPGVGNFLRKTSLDELPQLWNVLLGDMSLVGPRPFVIEQTSFYGDVLNLYHKVRPGITGLWQVSGRNFTSFEERVNYDAYYVRNWSIWLDMYILARTVKTVIFREGAY